MSLLAASVLWAKLLILLLPWCLQVEGAILPEVCVLLDNVLSAIALCSQQQEQQQ